MGLSRSEDILEATINGDEYDQPPQSRIEKLLIDLKDTISGGGGGGGSDKNIKFEQMDAGNILMDSICMKITV